MSNMNNFFCILLCFVYLKFIFAHPVENTDDNLIVILQTPQRKNISVRDHPNNEKTETFTLTPHQRTQLEKFRTVVSGLLDDEYEMSDEYLLGYLMSKKWQIFPAEQMLKIAKNWKETHNMKELAKSNFSQEMLTRFPIKLDGYDTLGCPLTEIDFGNWNIADYISKQEFVRDGVQNLLKHYWQFLAKMELRNRNNFPKCHQTRTITTLKNYNATNLSEVNSIGSFVKMLTDYSNYTPNLVFASHLVDVPDTFKPLVQLMKANLNEDLSKLITVHEGPTWMMEKRSA